MTGTSAQPRRAMAACLLAAAVAGCSSSPSGGSAAGTTTSAAVTPTTAAGTATSAAVITIKNFEFRMPASVRPGATVTVHNEDATDHTVTADSGKAFDAQAPSGGSSSFTAPSQPGSYPFHCSIHPFMKGNLVVA